MISASDRAVERVATQDCWQGRPWYKALAMPGREKPADYFAAVWLPPDCHRFVAAPSLMPSTACD